MPREIIDTQSSRPRYIRRTALRAAGLLVLLATGIFAVFVAYGHFAHLTVPGK